MKIKIAISAVFFAAISMPVLASSLSPEFPQAILPMHETSKPVDFDHMSHQQVDCRQCHHKVARSEISFTPYKCSSCHLAENKDKSDNSSYFNIIHGRKALADDRGQRCLSCHVTEQKSKSSDEVSLIGCSNSGCHK